MDKKVYEIMEAIEAEIDNHGVEGEYIYYDFHRNRYLFILNEFLKVPRSSDSFLDIGSHYCQLALGAKYIGFDRICGIDLPKFNEQARQRANRNGIFLKNCDLSIDRIPFTNNCFNFILFSETIEHFNFHPRGTINEVFRVLKPGGTVMTTTPNLARLNNRIKMLLGISINADIREKYHPGTHYREYTAGELECLFRESGFKVVTKRFLSFKYPGNNFLVEYANLAAGSISPSFKSNICIIAKK